jgi:hypothetical protein
MPQDARIQCKWCQQKHTISEGCLAMTKAVPSAPKWRDAPEPQQREASVTATVTPVTRPVTPVTTSVTESERCVCPTCGAAHRTRPRLSSAEKQRAYRARRQDDQ